MEPIETTRAPHPVGPYSQAIATDHLVFCSGQIGIDPVTGKLAESLEEETRQALKNLQEVVQAAGSALNKVIRTEIYLVDISTFEKVNKIYATFFPSNPPARLTLGVAALPKNARIEIACIAFRPAAN